MTESTPENGPRIEIDHEKTIETQILVERGSQHPAGPGVTLIHVYRTKKGRS